MKTLLKLDAFPHPFFFQLPNGDSSLPSRTGLISTILLAMIVGGYGWFEFVILVTQGEARIYTFPIHNGIGTEEVF